MRVRAVQEAVMKATGRPLSHTLNQDECCSRGCALQCAMLSPLFRVKDYEVKDVISYPVRISWAPDNDNVAMDIENSEADASNHIVIFQKGQPTPFYRRVTYHRTSTFSIEAEYDD